MYPRRNYRRIQFLSMNPRLFTAQSRISVFRCRSAVMVSRIVKAGSFFFVRYFILIRFRIDEKGCECFECMIHPFEMYVCQEGERCFQKNNVCDESFLSRCPNATQMDRDYCALMKLETSGI